MPLDTDTLNKITLAILAGEKTPEAAGLPATAEVKRVWDSVKDDLENLPNGAFVSPLNDLPDLD